MHKGQRVIVHLYKKRWGSIRDTRRYGTVRNIIDTSLCEVRTDGGVCITVSRAACRPVGSG